MTSAFHTAGARGFQRPPRVIEPDIASGDHLPRHMHVVVLKKHEAALQIAKLAQMDDVLNVTLAVVITWMGFSGKNELHGARLIPRELNDVFELLKDQRGAFIGGETPRKTNRQRVGREEMVEGDKVALGHALALD